MNGHISIAWISSLQKYYIHFSMNRMGTAMRRLTPAPLRDEDLRSRGHDRSCGPLISHCTFLLFYFSIVPLFYFFTFLLFYVSNFRVLRPHGSGPRLSEFGIHKPEFHNSKFASDHKWEWAILNPFFYAPNGNCHATADPGSLKGQRP